VRKPGFGGSAPLPVEPPQPDDPGVVDDEPEEEGERRSNAL
jgi:hypothetical protein